MILLLQVQINENSSVPLALRSYLEFLLSLDEGHRSCILRPGGWVRDKVGLFDDATNPAFIERQAMFAGSRIQEFEMPVPSDFFRSAGKFFPPHTAIDIRAQLVSDMFLLLTPPTQGNDYKLDLMELKLSVRFVTVNETIATNHQRLLYTRPFIFNYIENKTKAHQIAKGSLTLSVPHLYMNILPKSFFFFFVDSDALSDGVGAVDLNPFNFQPHGLRSVVVRKNGVIQSSDHSLDFPDATSYARAYIGLQRACGFLDSATSNDLGFEEYSINSFVVGFDLTAGLVNFKNLTPSEMGDISIDLTFRTKTTKALTCVFYASYQSILQLDKERTVTHRVF